MKANGFKRKPCLLNVLHNENSSKNININISYNLGSPKQPQSLKGRRISHFVSPVEEKPQDLLKYSTKHPIPGCEVSVKVFKKKNADKIEERSLIKNRTSLMSKGKKRIGVDQILTSTHKQSRDKRFFTEYEESRFVKQDRQRFFRSQDRIRVKSEPRVRPQEQFSKRLRRNGQRALSEQKPKRVRQKSTILQKNRTQADLKQKVRPKKKRESMKEIPKPLKVPKRKEDVFPIKKPKKPRKKTFFSHGDFEPFLISKILNSSVFSDQIQSSSMNSKDHTDRKPISRLGDTVNLFKNTNSIQLVPINQIRQLERLARLRPYADEVNQRFARDNAANKIKSFWKEYHCKKIVQYYNSVFEKNSKEEFIQNFSAICEVPDLNLVQDMEDINDPSVQGVSESKHNASPPPEEEDTYFDINKYQQMVKKSLEDDLKQRQTEVKSSSITNSRNNSPGLRGHTQQQGAQQWNHINKLINNQFNNTASVDSGILLNQLIKQSQINRKWIQDGSPKGQKEQLKESGNFDQEASNQRVEFHSKTYDFEENGGSSRIDQLMNMELMNNSESQTNIRGEEIESYLDCGLASCGLVNFQSMEQGQMGKEQMQWNRQWNKLDFGQMQAEHPMVSQDTQEMQNQVILDVRQGIQQEDKARLGMQKYRGHSVFQELYNTLIEQACLQIHGKPRMQRMCKRFLSKIAIQVQTQYSIKTNFNYIKSYSNGLIRYVLGDREERSLTLKNINCILGPTSSEMLYYLRIDDYSVVEEEEDKEESLFVIGLDTFQRYEQILENREPTTSRQQMYRHFWHRALFQGLNQALDEHRPFGTFGRPYAWQVVPKMKSHQIQDNQLQTHMTEASIKLMEIVSYLGGVIAEKEDGPFQGLALSEQDFQQINQERVSRILADQLLEEQETWINYSDQKVEVELEIIDLVQEKILFQIGTELKRIQLRRALVADI